MSLVRSSAAIALIAFVIGCGDATRPPTVASLVVVPDTVRVGRGDSVQLSVSAVDDRGNAVPGVTPTFASSDTATLRVSPAGRVRSVGPVGSALVTVTAQAVSRPIPAFVLALPRAVRLVPSDTSIPQQGGFALRGSVVDGLNDPVPNQTITYQSLSPSILTVSASGFVFGNGAAGTATVIAQSGLLADTSTITVVAVANSITITPPQATLRQGDSVQFSAAVRDRHGDSMPGAPLTWSSMDTTIVRVSGTGKARSVGPGSSSIGASSGSAATFVPVAVYDSAISARLPTPGGPLGIAVSGDIAYVVREFSDKVQRLNLPTSTVGDSISVGSLPTWVAFNAAGTTAYVTNFGSQSISRINVATSVQTDTLGVTGSPGPVAVSADGTALFVTTEANRLYKIALATDSVVDSIALPATSHHLLMHPNDTLLYVATRDAGSVLEVNWRTMTVARTFTLGGRTQAMAISADLQELYVADETLSALRIVNLPSGTTDTPVALAGGGEGLALSADGTTLYVGLVFDGKVQVIDRVSRAITRTIVTGGTPRDIAVDAARARVLVANQGGWVDILH